jgi:malonate decarboxylase delta subunit
MEQLQFQLKTQSAPAQASDHSALCGVVGSGNLEILIRPAPGADHCEVSVNTSARGFGTIWQAVLEEFASRYPAGGTHIAIHDMGATPAVVSLRLGQALSDYLGGRS